MIESYRFTRPTLMRRLWGVGVLRIPILSVCHVLLSVIVVIWLSGISAIFVGSCLLSMEVISW